MVAKHSQYNGRDALHHIRKEEKACRLPTVTDTAHVAKAQAKTRFLSDDASCITVAGRSPSQPKQAGSNAASDVSHNSPNTPERRSTTVLPLANS